MNLLEFLLGGSIKSKKLGPKKRMWLVGGEVALIVDVLPMVFTKGALLRVGANHLIAEGAILGVAYTRWVRRNRGSQACSSNLKGDDLHRPCRWYWSQGGSGK